MTITFASKTIVSTHKPFCECLLCQGFSYDDIPDGQCGACGLSKEHTDECEYWMYLDSGGNDYKEYFENHSNFKSYNDLSDTEIQKILDTPISFEGEFPEID
jgi:hypothetical protein